MAFAQGLPLRAKEPFGLERVFTERKKKKMHPVVRIVSFMVKSFIAIVVLLCATWCTVLIYLLAVYGTQEGITFAFVSASFFALICSMIYHDRE